MMRLAVVGFGLIGGSVALAARRASFADHVTAIDRPPVLATAQARRYADACVDVADRGAAERALRDAALTVLAAPVTVIAEMVPWALDHGNVVTDCGSTKRRIVERARASAHASRFVAGHPMAGLPQGGLEQATPDLFQGSAWLLCPGDAAPNALELVQNLVRAVGARLVHLDADAHDAAVARTSHLPQLLASALTVIAARHAAKDTAGPAYERMTRAAGGPEPIWRDIFASNADEIAQAIRELCGELEPIAEELASSGGTERSGALLDQARRLRA